eukprot:jgi/Ulvmu1/2280/UM013_0127.1
MRVAIAPDAANAVLRQLNLKCLRSSGGVATAQLDPAARDPTAHRQLEALKALGNTSDEANEYEIRARMLVLGHAASTSLAQHPARWAQDPGWRAGRRRRRPRGQRVAECICTFAYAAATAHQRRVDVLRRQAEALLSAAVAEVLAGVQVRCFRRCPRTTLRRIQDSDHAERHLSAQVRVDYLSTPESLSPNDTVSRDAIGARKKSPL